MMDRAVDDRGRHLLVAEHRPSPRKLQIRGVYDAALLVRVSDHLEQEARALPFNGQIPELIENDEVVAADRLEFTIEPPHGLRLP